MNVKPNKQILFQVLMGVGGHEYTIYEDGTIEGFDEGALIINFHGALVDIAYERGRLEGIRQASAAVEKQ
jgi:hypothetical protein